MDHAGAEVRGSSDLVLIAGPARPQHLLGEPKVQAEERMAARQASFGREEVGAVLGVSPELWRRGRFTKARQPEES